MKKLLLFLIVLTNGVIQLTAQELSPEQLREDLRIFREGLERFHPEMYRYTDQETFEKHFAQIESAIQTPQTQRDFYKLLRPVLADLKDGHVKWIVHSKDQHYGFFEEKLFPLQLYFEQNKVFLLSHFGDE